MVAFLIALAATISIGIGLGATPGLNEYLHINWFWVIPVGGLIIGVLMGFVQFGAYRLTNNKPGKGSVAMLCLVAVAGLFSTYLGIWAFSQVVIEGQAYVIRDLVGFKEFMEITLSESAFEGRHGGTEFGRTGTTLLFIGDLLGAGLGTFFVWQWALSHYPFCSGCRQWMKLDEELQYYVPNDEQEFNDAVTGLQSADEQGGYRGLLQHFRDRKGSQKIKKEAFVFHVRHLFCPSCRAALLVGGIDVIKKDGNRSSIDETKFAKAAEPGGHFGKAIT